MNVADLYAIAIATGYASGGYLLWKYRSAYYGIRALGALLYLSIGMWVVFYASLPFVDQVSYQRWYVFLSRTAHTSGVLLILLTAKLGQQIVTAIKEAEGDDGRN